MSEVQEKVVMSGGLGIKSRAQTGARALESERAQEGESPSLVELPARNGK